MRILMVCPYRLLPPRGGGALRCYHLLCQLARGHQVSAIIFQREAELRQGADGCRLPESIETCNPFDTPAPPSWFDRLPRRIGPGLHYRWLRRSWRGPAEAALLRCHHLVREALRRHDFDAVVFDDLSSMTPAPLFRRLSPRTVRILNAANVDHELFAQQIYSPPGRKPTPRELRNLRSLEWTETHLDRFVHAVWACSEADRRQFEAHGRLRGFVIPNGVDTQALSFDEGLAGPPNRELLFCGSLAYEPNLDGLRWFLRAVWPTLKGADPSLRFAVVGSGGSPDLHRELAGAPGVDVVGEVQDVRPAYRRAAVAVCPLRIGSGTRLKILEAMSLGCPVVSTPKGAEGIDASHGDHLLLAHEPEDFALSVIQLLSDRKLFQRVRLAARRLVERRYDWNVIGEAARRSIVELVQARPRAS